MLTPLQRPFAVALEALTHRHRQLLTLHEVDRVRLDRIGEMLGLTPGQVRIELRDARVAMRLHLSTRLRNAA